MLQDAVKFYGIQIRYYMEANHPDSMEFIRGQHSADGTLILSEAVLEGEPYPPLTYITSVLHHLCAPSSLCSIISVLSSFVS
jgi:hypothetical protein